MLFNFSDELAEGVENLLLTIGSSSHLRSPKKSMSSKEKVKNEAQSSGHLTNSMEEVTDIKSTEKGDVYKYKDNIFEIRDELSIEL